jgi:E3 ubiquitin-protein ligase MARCH6
MNFPWDTVNGYIISLASKFPAEPSSNSTPSIITRLLESKRPIVVAAEPYVEALGKQARTSSYQVATGWTRMALGDGTGERVFAIALGYAVIGLLMAFYLNVFTVGSVKSAGRAVRSAVRQQLLVVKVATFIIIELVLFPLGCGINLDLCSIWLFPEASLQSRVAFFQYAPLTAIFYHWVVGTMFMYQFAMLLAGCRTIMRPGAMWFIKDPSDQNFHPIRDILERPALVQLRKLSVSAIMYGLVVACGVGSIGGLMCLGSGIVLPLRWKPREPLSDVPIDLLFLHILLPYTLRFFRPRKVIRKTSITIWKYLCARLRLTSYMFGGRHPEEERDLPHISWPRFGNSGSKVADGVLPFHGSYRRVPNSDNVAVPRDMRATVRVDVNGIPIDDEARELIAAQDAEAEKAKRIPKEDYTVVYIPPHFQYRIGIFIFALWVIGCVFVTAAVSAPILLGRGVFNLFTERQMHDGYSFLVGFYALWGCWVVGHAVERMDKRRQRRSADDARGNWPLYFLKRSVLWLTKISYIVFSVGIVIPALLGLVVELYIVMPIRLSLNPDLVPNVRVVDMWALGIVYAKIVLHANRLRPLNWISAGFNHIKAHGWTNPEPFSATAEVIAPLFVGLVGMLALPPAIVVVLPRAVPVQVDQRFILMHVYPGIFAAAGLIRLGITGSGMLSRWSQSIRDTEFLVEMRLRNYEQDKESEKKREVKGGGGDADGVVDTEGFMGLATAD